MNIVILQGAFLPIPPHLGGAVEKRWFKQAQVFAKLGHRVTHISRLYEKLPQTELIEGVEHRRVRGYPTPSSMWKLKGCDLLYTLRALRQVPPDTDILVTNTFWAPILFRRTSRTVLYVDVARVPKGQMRFYRNAARLRGNSTPVAEAIRSELPAEDHARVGMIPNPLPFTIPDETTLQEKKNVLLYCGRVHPEKGIHVLIQALSMLKTPWPLKVVGPWHIDQGGGGKDYHDQLVAAARGLPVEILGPIYDMEKLNQLYHEAAIFAYPSLAEKGETFGLAPLEGMAWGAVPVVSDLTCFKDFIRHQHNGIIFDHRSGDAAGALASQLEHLQRDPELLKTLSNRAVEVRDSHAPARIAQSFLEDFSGLLASLKKGS